MKKAVVLFFLLIIAGTAFGQNHTFQGLPWGASKDQVIAKMGQPAKSTTNDASYFYNIRLEYNVTVNGQKAVLFVLFHNNGMAQASYIINNPYSFDSMFQQLTNKYGAYHEQISYEDGSFQHMVWHFNNFHLYILSPYNNRFEIRYFSNTAWNKSVEEDHEVTKFKRIPNTGL